MRQDNDDVADAKREPEIFVSSKALEVAKGWVRSMLGDSDSDSEADEKTVELEPRPLRLGLGAKYLPHSKVAATMSPVEKKLRKITGAGKQHREGGDRFGTNICATSETPAKDDKSDADCDDDDEEEIKGSSRTHHGRQQRRIGSADLLMKTSGSKGRGSKRKHNAS